MKTRIPVDLITPILLTSVVKDNTSLHFTYSDGSSEDINILDIGQAVLSQSTVDANSKISTATYDFAIVNPITPKSGDIKTSGTAGLVYNDTWIQVTP